MQSYLRQKVQHHACGDGGAQDASHVGAYRVHDEVVVVHRPDLEEVVTDKVRKSVESYRDQVPLIGMSWVQRIKSWASKKGEKGSTLIKIRHPDMMSFD